MRLFLAYLEKITAVTVQDISIYESKLPTYGFIIRYEKNIVKFKHYTKLIY